MSTMMMKAETVSETLDCNSQLTWLIAQEDIINSTILYNQMCCDELNSTLGCRHVESIEKLCHGQYHCVWGGVLTLQDPAAARASVGSALWSY
jgi:hypothetical protein